MERQESMIRVAAVAAAVVGIALGATLVYRQLEARGREAARPKPPREATADERAIAEAGNHFAFDLYGRLRTEPGNLFFSPASISAALAMTYAGADGRTAEEMADVLHFTLPGEPLHAAYASFLGGVSSGSDTTYELRIANRLWGQEGFRFLPPFLDVTREHYGAELAQVDFAGATEQARQQINAWVADQTNQKIQDLLPSGVLDNLTRLVLTNAIYFKGKWADPFREGATQDAPFFVSADRTIDVPLMAQQETYSYLASDELQILELPYEGRALSMLVLLPRRVDGLADLEERLSAENFAEWSSALARREVRVFLPRFKLTSQFKLSDTLAAMGMPSAFDAKEADFSRMSSERDDIYISAVVHEAFVDVNEEGTEAAAATGAVASVTSAPAREPEVFRADRPFAFLIRDNATGSVLFLGRVTNPSE
jgi:serpin B